jgi:hypothetical protein
VRGPARPWGGLPLGRRRLHRRAPRGGGGGAGGQGARQPQQRRGACAQPNTGPAGVGPRPDGEGQGRRPGHSTSSSPGAACVLRRRQQLAPPPIPQPPTPQAPTRACRPGVRPRPDAGRPHRHPQPVLQPPGPQEAALQARLQPLHRALHGDLLLQRGAGQVDGGALPAGGCQRSPGGGGEGGRRCAPGPLPTPAQVPGPGTAGRAGPHAHRHPARRWATLACSGRRCCGPWACRRTST